jgi:thioredoxin 1
MSVSHITSAGQFYDMIRSTPKDQYIFVDFYTTWCGPCKRIAPILERLASEYSHIKFAKVNIEDVIELANRYNISSIPTFYLFSGQSVEPKYPPISGASESRIEGLLKMVKLPFTSDAISSEADFPEPKKKEKQIQEQRIEDSTNEDTKRKRSEDRREKQTTKVKIEHITSTKQFGDLLSSTPPDRYIFVDFYANWCGPCKRITPKIEKLASEYSHVKFVKINVDELVDLANLYHISSIPCFHLFSGRSVEPKFPPVIGSDETKIENLLKITLPSEPDQEQINQQQKERKREMGTV